jgi:hypothetical protein
MTLPPNCLAVTLARNGVAGLSPDKGLRSRHSTERDHLPARHEASLQAFHRAAMLHGIPRNNVGVTQSVAQVCSRCSSLGLCGGSSPNPVRPYSLVQFLTIPPK